MALNVNIIGKDSEGNLQALKVNSEGNLDFGQLETEIQVIKDNQGRLYGKYGEAWIPVKVDSEGRPIIASDVTVTADGLIVDLGQIKQGPAGTEPWSVQLSGNMVVEHLDDEHQWTDSRVFGLNVRMGSQGGFQPFPNRGSRYTIIYRNKASVQNSICLYFYKEATITAPENPPQRIAGTTNVYVATGESLTWNSKSPEMEALVSGGFPYFGVRLGGGGANSKQDVIIAGGGHA